MRERVYRIILSCAFVLLGLGLFFTQVLRGDRLYDMGLRNSIRLIHEEPARGRILDRNGGVMADNVLSFDASIIPQELKDKEEVFRRLAPVLSLAPEAIRRRYERGYLNPFTPVVIATNLPKTTAIILDEQSFDLPGVSVALNAKRSYPLGTGASHVLGYLGEIDKSRITRLKEYGYDLKDTMGYSGIEEELDYYLRGDKGGQQVEVDNRGRQVRLLGYRPPVKGEDVVLTIDLELQQIADELLKEKKGAFVLMDVTRGAIVAMSSAPAFDPNVFVDRKDRRLLNYYLISRDAPLFNRALQGRFAPGSVFKVVTAAAAMKAKGFPPTLTFVCHGQLRVGNRYFKCWDVHGPQDFYQAMGHSCDVYFYQLGLMAGADNLTHVAHEFGFGNSTGISGGREASGFVPSRLWKRLNRFEGWYDGDTANFSIGQGFVLVTPLQVARMMAAVANGGYLVTPYLIQRVGAEDAVVKEPKKIGIPQKDLDLLKKALRYPVSLESGTAREMDVPGLKICAKTGTAQVTGHESHGWVAGFFPQDDPQYAFCILLENVGSSHYACALGREFFEEAMRRNKFP